MSLLLWMWAWFFALSPKLPPSCPVCRSLRFAPLVDRDAYACGRCGYEGDFWGRVRAKQ
jgi:hypothetical protein